MKPKHWWEEPSEYTIVTCKEDGDVWTVNDSNPRSDLAVYASEKHKGHKVSKRRPKWEPPLPFNDGRNLEKQRARYRASRERERKMI